MVRRVPQGWLLAAFILLFISMTISIAHSAELSPIPLTFVKGGCFTMGDQFGDGGSDEKPLHDVCVGDFYLGTYEVTEDVWRAVMGGLPDRKGLGASYPVTGVSWNDVREFIRKLNRLSGLDYRLPTEAEWEYAARGGGKRQKYAGTDSAERLAEYAWHNATSNGSPQPVGKKLPNDLGIHDMSGNAWEWVQDRYDPYYYRQSPRQNPAGDPFGVNRVLRGGSYSSDAGQLRASYRDYIAPDRRADGIGFRLLLPAR